MFFLSDLLYSICRFITSPEMDWNVIFLQDRANYWDKWRRTSTAENSKLQARYKTLQINPGSQEVSSGLIGWIHRAIGKVNFWYLLQTSKAKKKSTEFLYRLAQAERRGELLTFTRCCLCKAFPDIRLGRFQGLEGLLCRTLTQLPSFSSCSYPCVVARRGWHLNLATGKYVAGNMLHSGKENYRLVFIRRLINLPYAFVTYFHVLVHGAVSHVYASGP